MPGNNQFRARCELLHPVLRAQVTPENVATDPTELVRLASKNELAPGNGHPYRFKLRKVDDGKITTKEIVETKDGDVARLIAVNDKPLPPDNTSAALAGAA